MLEEVLAAFAARRPGEVNKAVTVGGELSSKLQEKMHSIDGAVGCLTAQFFVSQ